MEHEVFSQSNSESDLEFWRSLALVHLTQLPVLEDTQANEPPTTDTEPPRPQEPLESPEPPSRRELRLIKLIDNLRVAKEVEIKDALVVAYRTLQVKCR
jgi:hypothetical protein